MGFSGFHEAGSGPAAPVFVHLWWNTGRNDLFQGWQNGGKWKKSADFGRGNPYGISRFFIFGFHIVKVSEALGNGFPFWLDGEKLSP